MCAYRSEENPSEHVLTCHPVGSRDRTQAIGISDRPLYPLSPLTHPLSTLSQARRWIRVTGFYFQLTDLRAIAFLFGKYKYKHM